MNTGGRGPQALLLMAPGCAHCPEVLAALSALIESGRLARLEVINTVADPGAARAAGTRSVPWVRIGPYELQGAHSRAELLHWTDLATAGAGLGPYFSHLLETGALHTVVHRLRRDPEELHALVMLLEGEKTPLSVRIGVGAVLEELAESGALRHAVPALEDLAESRDPRNRADACHYLGLADTASARLRIRLLLEDPDPTVREIAAETLGDPAEGDS